jgi:NDP-sugar pyrophosphorylase family protein
MTHDALLLAAGIGQRLHPYTETVPKPMIEIAGKPILQHNVELVARHGIRDIVINLHHLPNVIRSWFGNGATWGVRIEYLEEQELLGTAGTVRAIEAEAADPLCVIYGDNITGCDLTAMKSAHSKSGSIATVAVHRRENPTSSGMALIDDNETITGFIEKPSDDEVISHWVSAGVMLLSHEALGMIGPDDVDIGRDLLPRLAANARVKAFRIHDDVVWIDTIADLDRANDGGSDR